MQHISGMNSGDSDLTEKIRAVISHAHAESPQVLNILHALQHEFRHIPAHAVVELASHLDVSISQVESAVDFYSFYSRIPRGHYDFLFSTCTSCGDAELREWLCRRLGVETGRTRSDGLVSISETSCIGMCDHGAALLVNGRPVSQLDSSRLENIARLIEERTHVQDWPQELFRIDDHVRLAGLLLNDVIATGDALSALQQRGSEDALEQVIASGLRGRGGAGFSAGMKWKFCRDAPGAAHYVVCNADEGEPGTFKDRILLSSHADEVFDGMTVCARLIGANRGWLYLRGEYRYLLPHLRAVLDVRRKAGLLGPDILGQDGFDFDIDIVTGAGAYICGEESALIESLEGKRGIPRIRPPFPVSVGYQGQPTVVNNVETFAAAAHIVLHGGQWFRNVGTARSAGSKLLSISGDCAKPGVYEYPFGVTLQQVLDDCGADNVQAVQVGGPSGMLTGPEDFGRKLEFDDLPTGGSIMIFNQDRDLLQVIFNFSRFFAHESCGFCTPCRVGTTLLRNVLGKITAGRGTQYDLDELQRIGALVKRRSHCGLGQTAANAMLDLLQRFPGVIEQMLVTRDFVPHFDLDAALAEARELAARDDRDAHLEQGLS